MNYYQTAKKASQQIAGHPGLEILKSEISSYHNVLDVGCGEGTRLNLLLSESNSGTGLDASRQAISLAKKHYPHHKFLVGLGERLPFGDASFDLVYSAFAIEHCINPEKFIMEMIRVCRPGGKIFIFAPNYGSPNRRSPVSLLDPLSKLCEGLIKDLFPHPGLDWNAVTPRDKYRQIDDDTTYEPYQLSLVRFLSKSGLKISNNSSLWELEGKPLHFHHRLFSFLGRSGLFPFNNWGPQVFVSAVK
jgi:ubiquinone/menaquinone biosynthesis C-methylase UbiE